MHQLILYKFRKITPVVCTFHPKRFCFQTFLSPSLGNVLNTSNVYVIQKSKDSSDIKLFYFNHGTILQFDMVDIRVESFLKKFACLGMPFIFFLLFFLFCLFFLVFLTAEYRIILPCIKLSKMFQRKVHFTIYGKLDIGLENVLGSYSFHTDPSHFVS